MKLDLDIHLNQFRNFSSMIFWKRLSERHSNCNSLQISNQLTWRIIFNYFKITFSARKMVVFLYENGRFKYLFIMYFAISILVISSFERFKLIQNLFFGFILTTWHLGAGTSTDIKEGMQCKIVCNAAYPTPEQIKCLNTGWDHESVSTTVTKSWLT